MQPSRPLSFPSQKAPLSLLEPREEQADLVRTDLGRQDIFTCSLEIGRELDIRAFPILIGVGEGFESKLQFCHLLCDLWQGHNYPHASFLPFVKDPPSRAVLRVKQKCISTWPGNCSLDRW